ncbi:hypothetical protein mRhiFer1_008058 [Rhinolophus ferrumequinum]|uniref:Uncharacterized protein n=1 Tax=Rhinolophus ferrumequinum TaxID=59479 RepID=A0A7J7WQS3_RHIFE|nr:hypothetical protein mRhiFer1_008058 [Rhinolophus ferrumequinum]
MAQLVGACPLKHKVASSTPARDGGLCPLQLETATGAGADLCPPQLRLKGQQLKAEWYPAQLRLKGQLNLEKSPGSTHCSPIKYCSPSPIKSLKKKKSEFQGPARWLRWLELCAPNSEGFRFDPHMGQWALNHKVASSIPRGLSTTRLPVQFLKSLKGWWAAPPATKIEHGTLR